MAISSPAASNADIWDNLKRAISQSSGFQRWVADRALDITAEGQALDALVHSYLRETLETLAY
jgi:hypothetical protein